MPNLVITAQPAQALAVANWLGTTYPALIGKNGPIDAAHKREGDMCSPLGPWPMLYGLYRADKVERPQGTGNLPWRALTEEDGWCDEPKDLLYNHPVPNTYPASHEQLWRENASYDYLIVLGYNMSPTVPGKGSAIFLHVWRQGGEFTAGCAALPPEVMAELAPFFSTGDTVTFAIA